MEKMANQQINCFIVYQHNTLKLNQYFDKYINKLKLTIFIIKFIGFANNNFFFRICLQFIYVNTIIAPKK